MGTRIVLTDRPLAAPGLTSYRYRGRYGWIMIGAPDHAGALREALRSLSQGPALPENLEVWDGTRYVPAHPPSRRVDRINMTPDERRALDGLEW